MILSEREKSEKGRETIGRQGHRERWYFCYRSILKVPRMEIKIQCPRIICSSVGKLQSHRDKKMIYCSLICTFLFRSLRHGISEEMN